ncbi:E3 ubiquitin-protein ligase BRE1 [Microdochium nivale]|nr:E3 ubiquitin-protein ligase BRE1 [Microdochium nivale]
MYGLAHQDLHKQDYQKDAIYRQMLEYKREKATLETRLAELAKKAAHHDDHLRIVDAWWLQLIEEIGLMAQGVALQSSDDDFATSTQFREVEDFQAHLQDHGSEIKQKVDKIISNLAASRGPVSGEVTSLEKKATQLLAKQKGLLVKIDGLNADKESLSDQLNTATLRYMKAERKLDRSKSKEVQKLEARAIAQSTGKPPTSEQENGTAVAEDNVNHLVLQSALQEANAVTNKQKEQLETALARNKTLQEELTAAQARLTSLTDEDYARTDVYKLFKVQHEELIKQVNHLETSNKLLVARNDGLNKERELSRKQVESEAQRLIAELEEQLQQEDTTLARVRAARDEAMAELSQLKAAKAQEKNAAALMEDLVSAKEDRIKALEAEVSRLQSSEDVEMTGASDIDALTIDELRIKYNKLAKDYESIETELPSLTAAVKKFQATAHKKVADLAAQEDRVAVAIAEKSKADQKYFGARKDADQKEDLIKKLRIQNSKSSEIITQLKEVEVHNRTLVTNLDKQLADMKQSNTKISSEKQKMEASSTEALRRYDVVKQQLVEFSSLSKSKDSTTSLARERTVNLEAEVERLKVRLETAGKERDKWKAKSMSNSSEEEEMLRNLATCSICRNRFKDTVLRTCGHIFCKPCVDDRVANRMRKCPTCSRAFDKSDAMSVHL